MSDTSPPTTQRHVISLDWSGLGRVRRSYVTLVAGRGGTVLQAPVRAGGSLGSVSWSWVIKEGNDGCSACLPLLEESEECDAQEKDSTKETNDPREPTPHAQCKAH